MNSKLKMESMDMTQHNIDRIAELFPQVITEVQVETEIPDPNNYALRIKHYELKKAVDFEKLKLVLSAGSGDYVVADDERERYEFTWVGKRQAMIDAATPIRKTLRPCVEESVNFDTTENMYIEGDNLEVLKLLQESYLGKVKMIYIDPPYNTGKDFVYKDNFTRSVSEYNEELGMRNEEYERLFQNTETNGRFHSDWCSMIYPRLQLARNLLTDDGVIFISIGEEEVDNMIKIGNEVFGNDNHLGTVVRVSKTASNKGTYFAPSVDYLIVYGRNNNCIKPFCGEVNESLFKKVELEGDRKGEKYRDDVALYQSALDPMRGCANQRYYIQAPDGSLLLPPGTTFPTGNMDGAHIPPVSPKEKVWRWSYPTYFANKHLLVFKETKSSPLIDNNGNKAKYNVYTKSYLSDRLDAGTLPRNIWDSFINRKGADLLKKMDVPFDFSKPVELIGNILKVSNICSEDIILDFFSGSATTAHAVMQLNAEDGGNRKFIMVQLPEETDEKSEAYKAGYKNICEIGKERIRRAGKVISDKWLVDRKENTTLFSNNSSLTTNHSLDTGFRVFKTDTTNMKDVYYSAGAISQATLFGMESNIKDDRTDIDLLYGALLDWGVELTYPHTAEQIDGYTVHMVDTPATDEIDIIACFDKNISEKAIREIASRKPLRALFRDHSFADSANKINVYEIFKAVAPDTSVKVM